MNEGGRDSRTKQARNGISARIQWRRDTETRIVDTSQVAAVDAAVVELLDEVELLDAMRRANPAIGKVGDQIGRAHV